MPASPLSTDLYQLTMMAGYFARGRHQSTVATFEVFVRRLPPHREYLIAAGLGPFIEWLDELRFTDGDIACLRATPALASLPDAFFDYLRGFRFSGDVWAMPEGMPFFPNEPILRVVAPIAQAQLLETAALAHLNFQTSIATKASRIVAAAEGRPVMEFGARRAHGLGAALHASRAAYLAGCTSTSFVEAGCRFEIPMSGTMAHSWVLSARDEIGAFRDYVKLFGERSVLLLDTYDTLAAARHLAAAGLRPGAVRLDSGDLASLSREVRRILDDTGLRQTQIIASGDLDEYSIARLVAEQAPIDGFGVGTMLVTSADAPALGGVYKLVALTEDGDTRLVMKKSTGKATWPGAKQVWRHLTDGRASSDTVALADEPSLPGATPLLQPVLRAGRAIADLPALEASREWCRARVAELPAALLARDPAVTYRVDVSPALFEALSQATTYGGAPNA